VHGLGALLRESLTNSGEHEVRLGRELELLGHYIDIQRIRFQDRLAVDVIVEPGVDGALVPNLLLQPLVENAIRHGIGPRANGGIIEVRVVRHGTQLRLQVTDDGVGAAVGATGTLEREGIGLGNTRARLHHLYGDAQRMAVTSAPGMGFTVAIELPFRQ
jgi:LytS/YehU family sensor histidine kinase